MDWLHAQKSLENRSRAEIDEALREERRWNRVGAVVFAAGEITGLAR